MPPRQPPRIWLMTDERLGAGLFAALERLPRGSGIVFRHHATPAGARRALFELVRRRARARGLLLVLAGSAREAVAWRADGVHARRPTRAVRPLLRTAAVHGVREAVAARRAGAGAAFVSPLFATRSHPGARPLGHVRGEALLRAAGIPAIALGGMTARRARTLRHAYGWAAIDAWGSPLPEGRARSAGG